MKRLLAWAIMGSLLTVGLPSKAAPWNLELDAGPPGAGMNRFSIAELYTFAKPSFAELRTMAGKSFTNTKWCVEFGQEPCTENLLGKSYDTQDLENLGKSWLDFSVTMPVCANIAVKDFCIEDVRLYKADGEPTSAAFLRDITGPKTSAVEQVNIPAGGTASLWRGAPGSGFETLQVAVYAAAEFRVQGGPPTTESRPYTIGDFSLEIRPYVLDASRPRVQSVIPPQFAPPPGTSLYSSPPRECTWQDETGCGVLIDYPSDVKVGVTLRSKNRISEFFNGRLSDPVFSAQVSSGMTTIKVDAAPVTVPQLSVLYSEESGLREKLKALMPGTSLSKPYFPNSFEAISILREVARDTASGENTMWRLSSMGDLHPCYQDKGIAGLVVTNATAYGGRAPELKDGFLDYQVAGMHYLSNGKDLFEGTYDLVIKSDVARCLYGYTSAPVSATISVIGAGGEQKVATTEVSERDGWLKLSAKGFTFSENTVRAKITQPKGSGPRPIQAPPVSNPNQAPVAFDMASFRGATVKLNSSQLASIQKWVLPNAKTVKCIGLFTKSTPKERALALSRAQNVCAEIKKRNKAIKTSANFGMGAGANLYGKVIVDFR